MNAVSRGWGPFGTLCIDTKHQAPCDGRSPGPSPKNSKWPTQSKRIELDRVPLWRGNHVGLKQLAEDFAQYLYLPRLKDSDVLLAAVRDGLGLITWRQESFAYADGWDAEKGRYRGLRAGQIGSITLEGESVLVKPEVAATQLAEEEAQAQPIRTPGTPHQPYEPTAPATGQGEVANGEATAAPRVQLPQSVSSVRLRSTLHE